MGRSPAPPNEIFPDCQRRLRLRRNKTGPAWRFGRKDRPAESEKRRICFYEGVGVKALREEKEILPPDPPWCSRGIGFPGILSRRPATPFQHPERLMACGGHRRNGVRLPSRPAQDRESQIPPCGGCGSLSAGQGTARGSSALPDKKDVPPNRGVEGGTWNAAVTQGGWARCINRACCRRGRRPRRTRR